MYNPSYVGGVGKRITGLEQKQETLSKNNKSKRAEDMAQVVMKLLESTRP
jgi:hypothetical protein